jgi:uncharacterized spore protein YtfJ
MNETKTLESVDSSVDSQKTAAAAALADRFVDRLAERLGGAASTSAVFGAPVDRGGITVVPVARVRWGFGGGAGHGGGTQGESQGEGHGEGGGGGMAVSPLGYIEISDGEAEFHRIFDPTTLLFLAPMILALGIALRITLAVMLAPRSGGTPGQVLRGLKVPLLGR